MNFIYRGVLSLFFVFFISTTIFSATYTVTKTTDSNDGTCDADCSLREAITAANATADDDIVAFSLPLTSGVNQTINVTLGEIVITGNGSLTINGTGADLITINGNMNSRILTINTATVFINDLTFTGGTGAGALNTGRGGAIYNAGGTTVISNTVITGNTGANGGALNNASTGSPAVPGNLTLINCVVSNNTSTSSGGGIQNFSTSTLIIESSTFMGNTSGGTTGGGGGQLNGIVRITNSTFANNNAPGGSGGGIQSNGTNQIITNSTFSNNTSTNNGGGLHRGTTNVNLFIRNTIIAGNNGSASSPDVTNSTNGISSEGTNIIGNVGTSTGWVASDLTNTDPMLLPLADNGGFGMTFLPNTGSPAIDAGQNCVVDLSCATSNPPNAVVTDQRGVGRPAGSAVDIGSVEVAAASATVSGRVVNSSGRGIPHAIVSISPAMLKLGSSPQFARTNIFGYFSFSGVQTGQTYTLDASAKEQSFTPQNVQVNGDVSGITLTANGSNSAGKKQ